MKIFKCENLEFRYSPNYNNVINNVSVEFKKNHIHTLIGLNGSGKTTLIKILTGLLTVNSGSVTIGDKNIFEYTDLERSRLIAYVPQGIYNGDDYTVLEYLSFGLMNTLKFYQSPSKPQEMRIKKATNKFGITQFLNKKINQLSGGEKQIISICRAYVQDTEIMILDEPTSALDFKNQALVLNILKEVASIGKTIILSTHNPNHALFLESEALLISNGVIIKKGSAVDVVNKEVLSLVYGDNIEYSKNLNYDEISIR